MCPAPVVRVMAMVVMIIIPIPGNGIAREASGSSAQHGSTRLHHRSWPAILIIHGRTTHAGGHQSAREQEFNKMGFHTCVRPAEKLVDSTDTVCRRAVRAVP